MNEARGEGLGILTLDAKEPVPALSVVCKTSLQCTREHGWQSER